MKRSVIIALIALAVCAAVVVLCVVLNKDKEDAVSDPAVTGTEKASESDISPDTDKVSDTSAESVTAPKPVTIDTRDPATSSPGETSSPETVDTETNDPSDTGLVPDEYELPFIP